MLYRVILAISDIVVIISELSWPHQWCKPVCRYFLALNFDWSVNKSSFLFLLVVVSFQTSLPWVAVKNKSSWKCWCVYWREFWSWSRVKLEVPASVHKWIQTVSVHEAPLRWCNFNLIFASGICFVFVTWSHLLLFWFCFWAESPRLTQYSCCLGGRAVVGEQTHHWLAQLWLQHPEPESREQPPTGPAGKMVCALISAPCKWCAWWIQNGGQWGGGSGLREGFLGFAVWFLFCSCFVEHVGGDCSNWAGCFYLPMQMILLLEFLYMSWVFYSLMLLYTAALLWTAPCWIELVMCS